MFDCVSATTRTRAVRMLATRPNPVTATVFHTRFIFHLSSHASKNRSPRRILIHYFGGCFLRYVVRLSARQSRWLGSRLARVEQGEQTERENSWVIFRNCGRWSVNGL